jgi:uncharacterized protein (TIGR00730 family)
MGGARRRRFDLGEPELDGLIEELLARAQARSGAHEGAEHVRQLVVTALRLLAEERDVGDLKLVASAVKELRHAFRVFRPFEGRRKVSVFGSARTPRDAPAWRQASLFGERMTEQGWMTITGAGDGIMGAAQEGAGREHSFGVNIRLPFEQQANPVIAGDPKLINFRYFFTRKVMFVKESHAVALFPGGFGTHDEGFEALTLLQTGKAQPMPVVFVDPPGGTYWKEWLAWVDAGLRGHGLIDPDDLRLFTVTDDVDAAVAEIVRFYANYHSSRFVGDHLVIRLRHAPDAGTLARLNAEFGDLVVSGPIELSAALPEEAGEHEALPRLVLDYDRRRSGRLRMLIDRLNALAPAPEPPLAAAPQQVVAGRLTPEEQRAEDED